MVDQTLLHLPSHTDVVIDTPRFSLIKRRDDGRIDFVSPLPCPFNYGSVPESLAEDGDRIDAVVLGPRLARGTRVHLPVHGMVRFIDNGVKDPKWICAVDPLSAWERQQLAAFFALYAVAKRVRHALHASQGDTRCDGLWLRDAATE